MHRPAWDHPGEYTDRGDARTLRPVRKPRDDDTAEIASLRDEVERHRAATLVTLTGMFRAIGADAGVVGSGELVLQLGPDNRITYLNDPMATLLGIPNRDFAVGTSLKQYDHGPLGAGTLSALTAMAREAGTAQILERPFPGVRPAVLPDGGEPRPAITPILRIAVSVVNGTTNVVIHDVTRLRWLEATFARYVSPKVIEEMQARPASEFLAMQRRELTILFADLRGFTALSESLAPEAVGEVVNSFLGNMVGVIEAAGGTIDKFVGDEVMALFGAPIPSAGHALRALYAALDMQRRHKQWMEQRASRALPALPMGIGLATGEVIVGNVGTQSRTDYTVLGHTVNLAARLCGAAEGGEILTTRTTQDAIQASIQQHTGQVGLPLPGFRAMGTRTFKNVSRPVEVVSLVID